MRAEEEELARCWARLNSSSDLERSTPQTASEFLIGGDKATAETANPIVVSRQSAGTGSRDPPESTWEPDFYF